MTRMMKMSLWLLSLGFAVTFTAAEPACLPSGSCVGRCGEAFTRGQQCSCDFGCLQHNDCCPDFAAICTSDESCQGRCGETFRRGRQCECDAQCLQYNTCCHDHLLHCDVKKTPAGLPPMSNPFPYNPVPVSPSQGLSISLGSSTLQDIAQALGLVEGGPEGPWTGLLADADLCSDSPINGMTALRNGTILIFKGDLFWSVDPVSHSVGHPQSILDTLGVPSPIDTVFTRSNCHGNTYIIKGDQYWRLDGNMVMEPGYPKPLVSEFPGLTGVMRAALAVPATSSRPEAVYFFKTRDIMQKFTFPASSVPSCSKKPRGATNGRFTRQAVRSDEIKIRVSLKGFPGPVTSALTLPIPQRSDAYEHYVFSGPLFFHVQIKGGLPTLAKPNPHAMLAPSPMLSPAAVATNMAADNAKPRLPANSIMVWLQCP